MWYQYSYRLIALTLHLFGLSSSFRVETPLPDHVRTTRGAVNTILSQAATTDELLKTVEEVPTTDIPPVLKEIGDQRREFEMNLGRAMDVLRQDYPRMLEASPDYSIYDDNIIVTDPSGVQVKGISSYKNSIRFLQTMVRLFYNIDLSRVQMRSFYDFARNSIRISFSVQLVPRVIGDNRNSLYIDGISVYKLSLKSGKILEHRIENLLINDTPVTPPHGIFSALRKELLRPSDRLVPAGACCSENGNIFC